MAVKSAWPAGIKAKCDLKEGSFDHQTHIPLC